MTTLTETQAIQNAITDIHRQIAETENRRDALEQELAACLMNGRAGDALEIELSRIASRLKAYQHNLKVLGETLERSRAADFVALYEANATTHTKENAAARALQPEIDKLLEQVKELESRQRQHTAAARMGWNACLDMVQQANRDGSLPRWNVQADLDAIYKRHFNQ